MATALITGIGGQDGSYLAELLLEKGYSVYGAVRPGGASDLSRIAHIQPRLRLLEVDLMDGNSLRRALESAQPREVYNLAAQSFVPASWTDPVLTGQLTGLVVARLLEAVRDVDDKIRLYQASTSEMFGRATESPQSEKTALQPVTPYGTAKTYAHLLIRNYRETHGIYACAGILFNHESPRRSPQFVTRKITRAVARIKHGLDKGLELGNTDAQRDWGFAGDYVEAMWRMLQQDRPEDYVIATGQLHSVADLLQRSFDRVGLDWHDHVTVNPGLIRRAELHSIVGDAGKAREQLGWTPRVGFEALVDMMVDADLAYLAPSAPGATQT